MDFLVLGGGEGEGEIFVLGKNLLQIVQVVPMLECDLTAGGILSGRMAKRIFDAHFSTVSHCLSGACRH